MAWFWFVTTILIFVVGLLMESSIRNILGTIKYILEDEKNTPEGKLASIKIIVDQLVEQYK